MKPSRRTFLWRSGGLVVAAYLPQLARAANTPAAFDPNAFIHIVSDNTVTLWIIRSEMGQGVRTTLAVVLAEELEVDPTKVVLEQAMPGGRFKGIRLRTSGSGSSSGTFLGLRRAGATAREMLIGAAAHTWGVERSTCRAELGSVVHVPSGRKLTYGQLAEGAAAQPVVKNPPLKEPKDFRLIGKPMQRLDGPEIVTGKAVYGIDVRVPGMLVAVVARCPYVGGKLASFDAKRALAMPGVRHVVGLQSGIFPGVAVVADNTWTAIQGRDLLTVQWDPGPARDFDSDDFMEALRKSAASATDHGSFPIRRAGSTEEALAAAAQRLEAVYEFPFEAHAPIEPMNCVADVRDGSCEVWAPSQTPETAYDNVIKSLGLPPESVKIHTTLLGGGFGRRLFVDYVDEAVELSHAIRKPVQILWTRDDDMRNGFFHPPSVERLEAAIDKTGIRAWIHKSVGPDLSMFGLPTAQEKADPQHYAKDESPWGAYDTPYNFASMKIDYVPVDCPVPTGSWRAVEYPSRVFGRESFLDEVAHALGRDPLELRIELLAPGDVLALGDQRIDRGRMIRVLEAIHEKSGWTKPLHIRGASGRAVGRGLAINIYHGGSYLAQVAEVSLAPDMRSFRVHRIVCVVDCGIAINPAGIEGQVESAITWGLSATLHGKIDFRNGQAQQSGFHDFRVVRMNEMPAIETHIIPSTARPGGFGEHAVPPVAPAVANAIFAATGKRYRKLPIDLSAPA